MTPPHIIASACEGKKAFRSPQKAYEVASRHPDGTHYRCPSCGLWHVGRKPDKKLK